jgi:histidine phosphotransferase ChpT
MENLRLAQLLCSRICHDLITPVGAINNGFELLGSNFENTDKEMSYLIQKSAQNAAQRLMMFRAGYSYGGQNLLSSFDKTEQLLRNFLNSHGIQFIWSDRSTAQAFVSLNDQPYWGRIIVNLVSIIIEVAPKGGELSLSFIEQSDYIVSQLSLKGDLLELKPEICLALEGSLAEQDVTAQSIQSFLTVLLMNAIPIKLNFLVTSPENITLSLQNQTGSLQKSGTLF